MLKKKFTGLRFAIRPAPNLSLDPYVRKKFRNFFEIVFFKNHNFVPLKVLGGHPDDISRI